MKTVHMHIFDPVNSWFKQSANTRAECQTISCELDSCPLREQGMCIMRGFLAPRCPYGAKRIEQGFTKRAAKYWGWMDSKRKQYEGVGTLKEAPRKLAFIGDYVYLPYSHMDMNTSISFKAHSSVFVSGHPFLKKEDWTIENVLKMVDFRPQALIGGAITSYQTEEIPKFVSHLYEADRSMWNQLTQHRPEWNKEPSYVGRKAVINTLKPNIEWTAGKNEKYPVKWTWDGEHLSTTSVHAYNRTWGDVENPESVSIKLKPGPQSAVKVEHNDWVTPETVFID